MAAKARNLTNQTFGTVTALYPTEKRDKRKSVIWLCKCSVCEELVEKASIRLSEGRFERSCGCLMHVRNPKTLPGESGFNSLFHQYVHGAKRRNLFFELTKEEFKLLTSSNCYYCGQEPCSVKIGSTGKQREHGKYTYNGIDRKDNDIGYELENCVPCCKSCNKAKGTLGHDEFINLIDRISKNFRID